MCFSCCHFCWTNDAVRGKRSSRSRYVCWCSKRIRRMYKVFHFTESNSSFLHKNERRSLHFPFLQFHRPKVALVTVFWLDFFVLFWDIKKYAFQYECVCARCALINQLNEVFSWEWLRQFHAHRQIYRFISFCRLHWNDGSLCLQNISKFICYAFICGIPSPKRIKLMNRIRIANKFQVQLKLINYCTYSCWTVFISSMINMMKFVFSKQFFFARWISLAWIINFYWFFISAFVVIRTKWWIN